ncbi:MAG: hypothetical protein EWM72_01314 [Nitrospira sp.]|nr:MAG: hypothetical protein EWM72_01314 [Nitrospira sp.]
MFYQVKQYTFLREVNAMNRVLSVLAGLTALWPTLALAEEAGGSYRGIGSIYYTFMGAILIYGVYDTFGKRAAYILGPLIVIGLYLMLPNR